MIMKASEEFGEIIDRIDNLLDALELPMPAEFHVNQMKHALSDMSEKMKRIYVEEEGENPGEE